MKTEISRSVSIIVWPVQDDPSRVPWSETVPHCTCCMLLVPCTTNCYVCHQHDQTTNKQTTKAHRAQKLCLRLNKGSIKVSSHFLISDKSWQGDESGMGWLFYRVYVLERLADVSFHLYQHQMRLVQCVYTGGHLDLSLPWHLVHVIEHTSEVQPYLYQIE